MKTSTPIKRFVLAAAIVAMASAPNALSQDVVIIANSAVRANSISRKELRSIFLLRTKMLKDGSSGEPVLQKSGATHAAFLKRFLDRDSTELRVYYQGLVFTGKASMPKQLNSEAEVLAYVTGTRGAIGYVSGAVNTEAVRILTVASEDSLQERKLLTRVEPEYPDTLQHLGIGGSVRLELTISPKGAVETVNVLGGNPILAESAVKAVKKWVYAPWPSTSKMQVTVPFDAGR